MITTPTSSKIAPADPAAPTLADEIATWRIRYALGSPTGGRPLAREHLERLSGAIPTAEEIASVDGPPEPAPPLAGRQPSKARR